jgi:lipoprotein-anchoring transpeptidase ErfK/SrfK
MQEMTGADIDWAPASKYAVGSIVVSTPERALYLVTGPGEARRYSVGVGREGFQWSGTSTIVNKAEWPTWRPPAEMIRREAAKGHILPPEMAGGPENPLGARALYIGGTIFRIHGTNAPGSIGGAVSSGCIRMMNADVIELYERVKVGAKVHVFQ